MSSRGRSGKTGTGTARPDDDTIKRLNHLNQKEPDGFYIWRTVGDGKVRAAHAQFDGKVRAWSDTPDPGDDFNCRCWAESVENAEDLKPFNVAYKHLRRFEENKYTLSIKFLKHYLGDTGTKIT